MLSYIFKSQIFTKLSTVFVDRDISFLGLTMLKTKKSVEK